MGSLVSPNFADRNPLGPKLPDFGGAGGTAGPGGKDSGHTRTEKRAIKQTYGLYLRASVPGRGCERQ